MKILLVIMFSMSGQLTTIQGFEPREQPDFATCKERAAFALEYLQEAYPHLEPSVKCITNKGRN